LLTFETAPLFCVYPVYGQKFELLKEFIYTRVNADSSEKWWRQKERTKIKGIKILKETEQCSMRVPKMKVKVIENILAIVWELNDVIWGRNMRCENGMENY
jgi:hypothetical protein